MNPVFHLSLNTLGCSQNLTEISAIVLTECIKPLDCVSRDIEFSSRDEATEECVLCTFGCVIVGQFTYTHSIKNSPKIGHRIRDTVVPEFRRICPDIKRQSLCTSALLTGLFCTTEQQRKTYLKRVRQGLYSLRIAITVNR